MARWNSCNVLHVGLGSRSLWQFDAKSGGFKLGRELNIPDNLPLPAAMVSKSWSALWQPKLNVAYLPPETVFIRVAQFPLSTPDETRSMVELQLEKLSPIPLTQAVWSMHILPHAQGSMQTVVLIVSERKVVEEFLGRLEAAGFLADRLEVPLLDQLGTMSPQEDGAWVCPEPHSASNSALVAWWCAGVLQNLALLTAVPGPNRAANLRDQLAQMAWAGELEGWLKAPPRWHLLADAATASRWEPALREGLEQPLELSAPRAGAELAALTATRAAQSSAPNNLLPAEFGTRYRQQFTDRLWIHGLLWVGATYLAGVAIYFIMVSIAYLKTDSVESQVTARGPGFTNSMQLKARFDVLKNRQDLKFAALDCWRSTAELMPTGLTLDSLSFGDGRKLKLDGTAPAVDVSNVIDFSSRLRKAKRNDQPLFDPTEGDQLQTHVNPGGNTVSWSFSLILKRTED